MPLGIPMFRRQKVTCSYLSQQWGQLSIRLLSIPVSTPAVSTSKPITTLKDVGNFQVRLVCCGWLAARTTHHQEYHTIGDFAFACRCHLNFFPPATVTTLGIAFVPAPFVFPVLIRWAYSPNSESRLPSNELIYYCKKA